MASLDTPNGAYGATRRSNLIAPRSYRFVFVTMNFEWRMNFATPTYYEVAFDAFMRATNFTPSAVMMGFGMDDADDPRTVPPTADQIAQP